jgi:ABC-2 type transport system permease protein
MSLLEAGSLPWLVAHEVRLTFRNSKKSRRGLLVRLILLGLFLAGGIALALALRGVPIVPEPRYLVWGSATLLVLLTFMTTQALIAAQRTLFDKTDLDLLLSSPLPEGRVLGAKLLGIAASAAATYALLMLPLALPVALLGHPRLLAIVPVLAALALVAASVGLALSVVLVRTIGARGAKTLGQVMAAALGGIIYLVSQLSSHDNPARGRLVTVAHWMERSGWGTQGWSAWPARGLFGEPVPLLLTALFGVLLFGATSFAFRMHFLASYQSAGDRGSRRARPGEMVRTRFAGGLLAAVLMKELRLLAREPGMVFMMLLRLIYLMPLLFAGVKSGSSHAATLATLAAVGVVAAGQLCGSLAWVTISAEDAPDLLAVAPADLGQLKRMKLVSALVMGLPVTLLVPALLAVSSPTAAGIGFVGSILAGAGAGTIELVLGKPAKRSSFNNRRQGSLLTALAGIFVSIVTGGLTALLVFLVSR